MIEQWRWTKFCIAGVFIFLAFPVFVKGQTVEVSGHVTDAETHVPLYPATVFNKTTGLGTYADSVGYYSIRAHAGDELDYSYLGFYPVKYTVPAGLTIVHDVAMTSKKEKLQEVTIHSMTPYEQDSVDRIKTFKDYLDKPRYPLLGGASGGGFGLSLNLDHFTKESRRKRKFHKMYVQFEKDAFIDTRYTSGLVTQLTGLTGDSLTLFLYRYKPTYEFTRYATDLEFWSWIKMQYKLWIQPGK